VKHKLKTWALRSLVAALSLGLIVLVAGNVWLNTAGGKGRILTKVAAYAPGENASSGVITFFPWNGLTVRNVQLGEMFVAKAVKAEVKLASVLTKTIEISEVRFVEPVIRVTPAPQVVPVPVPAGKVRTDVVLADGGEKAGRMGQTSQTGLTQEKAAPAPVDVSRRVYLIARAAIEGGELVVLDEAGNERFCFAGLSMDVDLSDAKNLVGDVRAEKVRFEGQVLATNGSGRLEVSGAMVRLADMRSEFGGGTVSGAVSLAPRNPGAPFQVQVALVDVNVPELLAGRLDGVFPATLEAGKLNGEVRVQGYLQALAGAMAQMIVTVDGAEVRVSPSMADSLRGVETNADGLVLFEPIEVDVAVANRQVILRKLTLRSADTVLKSLGTMSANGDLNLSNRLYVDETLSGRVAALPFVDLGGSGLFFRDFLVQGNVRYPVSDFWQSGMMRPVREVISNLQKVAAVRRGGLANSLLPVEIED
jgi:hypothetical protein